MSVRSYSQRRRQPEVSGTIWPTPVAWASRGGGVPGRGNLEESDRRGERAYGGAMRNKRQPRSLINDSPVPSPEWDCECFAFVVPSFPSCGSRLSPDAAAHGMFVDSSPPIAPGHRAGCFLSPMPGVPPRPRPSLADVARIALPIPLAAEGGGRQGKRPDRVQRSHWG